MAIACPAWRLPPTLLPSRRTSTRRASQRRKFGRVAVRADASDRPSEDAPDAVLLLPDSPTAVNSAEQQNRALTPATLPPIRPDEDVGVQRRLTLARLVKGVYELEYRRLRGIPREDSPPARWWWESAHYDLVGGDVSPVEGESIDFLVYNLNEAALAAAGLAQHTRAVVLAVRGTLPSWGDGWHNLAGSLQRLHLTPRYRRIRDGVERAVAAHGADAVCVTGHSLGAALGLLAARAMAAERGLRIESHFFNPIYAYTWLPTARELDENDALWRAVRTLRCAAVAGLATVVLDEAARAAIAAEYAQVQAWAPHVYINTGDPICRGYWEYFANHERLARNGALGAYFARLAAPFSARGLLTAPIGSRPSHLIPSAVLHVCEGRPPDWPGDDPRRMFNHSLGTWMAADLPVHTREVRLSEW